MSVTPKDIAAAQAMLNEIYADPNPFSNLAVSIEDMKYQGQGISTFDPNLLLRILRRRAHLNQKTDAEFKKNFMSLAVLGTMRGFNLSRIKLTSTESTQNFIREMESVYRLKSGIPTSNEDANLARIAVSMVRSISKGLFAGTFNCKLIIEPNMICDNFPRCMSLSTFGFLIPPSRPGGLSKDHSDLLLNAFCYYQSKFYKIIYPQKNRSIEIRQDVERQFKCPIYTTDIRENHCIAVGLLESTDNKLTIKDVIKDPLEVAAAEWSKLQEAEQSVDGLLQNS